MKLADRLQTIVITATLTSVFWIVMAGTVLDRPALFGTGVSSGAEAPAGAASPPVAIATQGPSAVAAPVSLAAPAPPTGAGGLRVPVAGVPASALVDTFTASRGGGTRPHDAIDIMAPTGTPVVAAAAGVVEKLFLSKDGGKTVYVRLPDRQTLHYYAHLDQYAPGLREGARIAAGERLGTVGYSGNANPAAPHLHFAVLRTAPGGSWYGDTQALNPYPLLQPRAAPGR